MKVNSLLASSLVVAGNVASGFAPGSASNSKPFARVSTLPQGLLPSSGRVVGMPDKMQHARTSTAISLFDVNDAEENEVPEGKISVQQATREVDEILNQLNGVMMGKTLGMTLEDSEDLSGSPYSSACHYVKDNILDATPRSDRKFASKLRKEQHEATRAVQAYVDRLSGSDQAKAHLLTELTYMMLIPPSMAAADVGRKTEEADDVCMDIAYHMLRDIESAGGSFRSTYALIQALDKARTELGDQRPLLVNPEDFPWVDMELTEVEEALGFRWDFCRLNTVNESKPSTEWNTLRHRIATGEFGMG